MSRLPELGVMAFGQGRGVLDLALQAETAGAAHIWSADGNGGDAFATAGALAAVTSRVALGTAVALRVRSPLQTVFACATLDDLTGGKFVYGVGAGPKERMEGWHGLQHDPAVGRMREYLTVMRGLWKSTPDRPFSFSGRFYQVSGYGRPAQSTSSRLPIYLGCAGPLMTRLAGEMADGLIVHVLHSPGMVQNQTKVALTEGARRAGRSLDAFRLGVGLFSAVDSDRATAINRARRQILWALTVPYNPPLLARAGYPGVAQTVQEAVAKDDVAAALAALPDDLVRDLTLAGTPDDVLTRLREWGDIVDFVTLNGVGAYMNVVPAAWRLPYDELERNRQMMWSLLSRQ